MEISIVTTSAILKGRFSVSITNEINAARVLLFQNLFSI